MIHNLLGSLTGSKKIKGTVILMKKNVLDFNDFSASLLDGLLELVGQKVSLQLISAVHGDPANENKGKIGKVAYLENWIQLPSLGGAAGESHFGVEFDWQEEIGVPGAFIIKNNHTSQFYLRSLTLHDVPGKGNIHFACDSWVYPASKYKYNRIFFTNETSRVDQMPEPLRKYREEELAHLRGTGTGELKEYDRIYDYAYYNDLGDPDSGKPRQILGGSKEFPYPRRGRTGRAPTKTDPNSESRLFLLSLDIYVPRDERFGHLKMSDFLAYALKSLAQGLIPSLDSVLDPKSKNEFDTFEEVLDLYDKGIQLPGLNAIKNIIPWEMIKEIVRTDGEGLLKFPVPQVIKADKSAWRTDQEFGREMLAGVNPVIIQRLQVFPPTSNLDPIKYGDHTSSITAEHIVYHLGGLTVEEAIAKNRLYILDHHDALMLYLTRINKLGNAIYASRTILFLQDDGTLKPLVIELGLPHPGGEQLGAVNKIFTPASTGVEGSIWELAKAYVAVADSGVHQLISHWLNTHAVIEPFVIATNRQLSVVHPIYKLLQPHYRDTMNINALARQILINAGGVLESTVFPGKYAMEMSAVIYKSWVLTDQGLPADLLKRGVAVPDSSQKCGVRLLIEDYPYAVDGLEIWSAIDTWVKEYCSIYYPNDEVVKNDIELQAWWKEIREVGHGDKKDEPWWPTMQNINDLTQTCTTIIWVASALHAAVNFGQYPYAGYLPNRPTISRRFMPEPGTSQYEELKEDPEKAFLRTITSQLQTVVGVSLIEILSRHSSDEVYLGQRYTLEWTSDSKALDAFTKFGDKLRAIETSILQLNNNEAKKNRVGPVKVPYTLLYPNTSDVSKVGGLTGKGVPNSISI